MLVRSVNKNSLTWTVVPRQEDRLPKEAMTFAQETWSRKRVELIY